MFRVLTCYMCILPLTIACIYVSTYRCLPGQWGGPQHDNTCLLFRLHRVSICAFLQNITLATNGPRELR